MFKIIFEFLTDPLGLPISSIYEYIILAVIGFIAYLISYELVGKLYAFDFIDGKFWGKFCHWTIRTIIFILLWAITYGMIKLYYLVKLNFQTAIIFSIILLIIAFVAIVGKLVVRLYKKGRKGLS